MVDNGLEKLRERCEELLAAALAAVREEVASWSDLPHGTRTDSVEEDEGRAADSARWEAWLHRVNTYYYRSFHERVFPAYREEIEATTSYMFQVGRQQAALREGVAGYLLRCAQLCNRLALVGSSLASMAQEADARLQQLDVSRGGVYFQVRQVLQELRMEAVEAASWLEGLLESVRLAGGLEGLWRYPWARVALMACARAEAGASAATRRDDLQRAVAGLRRSAAEARELADTARAVGPVTALARLQGLAAGARTPDWMRVEDWLGPGPRQAWEHQAMVAGLCLELDIPRGAVSRRALQALAETACLLEAAAEALEAGAYLARRHPQVQRYLETLPGLEVRDLQALKRAVADLASGVEAAMARLGSDPETGPGGLDRLVEETVAVPERALRTLASMPELQVLRGAGSPLEGLLAAADLFAVKLRYWRDRLEALLAEAGRARSTAEWLKREASSFFHLRQDVEGLLHPRSLRRAWSDLELSVTRYPLQVGQPLPAEVVPLLDSLPVQQRPVPAGQHLVVLEAHGDLYRVEVAGESRWEVPFLVVGRAG